MNEFEEASARHAEAKLTCLKAERALAMARAELTIAERAKTEVFAKAVAAAEDRVLRTKGWG